MARTFSIIKPKSVLNNQTGAINAMIEKAGMRIIAQKRILMTLDNAKKFYIAHKDKPFYNNLCSIMASSPVIVQVLSGGDNIVKEYRDLIGATNPAEAKEGTIRKIFGENLDYNAVHGSESDSEAAREISFFFAEYEIIE